MKVRIDKSLYIPHKCIGYVTDCNPFVVNKLGEEIFLTATIGNTFQVYRLDRLIVCLVSKSSPTNITALQASGHESFVAAGKEVLVYDRTRIVRSYLEHESNILGLLLVGNILLSYDETNKIIVIDVKNRIKISELTTLQTDIITTIIHPATYLNKFLIAYQNGQLELWNIKKSKLIYTFLCHQKYFKNRNSNSDILPAISCMEQSPACDVVAIGFSSGDILLVNIKLDKLLFSYKQEDVVTSLSFRTDSMAYVNMPLLCSGSTATGTLHIWHLGGGGGGGGGGTGSLDAAAGGFGDRGDGAEDRRLLYSMVGAHGNSAVTKVHFLHGEPILVTSGADNSLKVWIFDAPDGTARLLRERIGTIGAPRRIRQYGGDVFASMRQMADATSCEMLCSGSNGSMLLLNTALPAHSREFSQKTITKKLGMQRRSDRLPTITAFDFTETRERDWGNVVTIHEHHENAYVWKHRHRAITEVILRQTNWKTNPMMYKNNESTHATSVAVSSCGNFAVVGHCGGYIHLYNLQSGLPRGSYPPSASQSEISAQSLKKRAAIPGNVMYEIHSMSSEALTTSSSKGYLQSIGSTSTTSAAVTPVELGHTSSVTGLFIDQCRALLVSCGLDGQLILWDFLTHTVTRRVDVGVPLLQMIAYRDAGFVAVNGQDGIIRIYDIVNGKLTRRFDGHSDKVTDMAFTPDGRRLLTSSMDATVRVWDIPTGRCLSWMKFESPVLSLTVSLSGDQISVSLSGREGVYMYVDRSLYETVHFWSEPQAPSPVTVSLSKLENEEDLEGNKEGNKEKEGGGGGGGGNSDHEDHTDLEVGEEGMEIIAPLGQVKADRDRHRESVQQRGVQVVTLSNLPKAYWVTLFHLEEIKQRNKPIEAPKAAPQAPFFLPTFVKEGSIPSFPTPEEYNKLLNSTKMIEDGNSTDISMKLGGDGGGAITGVISGKREGELSVAVEGGSRKKTRVSDGEKESEKELQLHLEQLASAWADDDEDEQHDGASYSNINVDAADEDGSVEIVGNQVDAGSSGTSATIHSKSIDVSSHRPKSRIIKHMIDLPRCTLAGLLWKHFPEDMDVDILLNDLQRVGGDAAVPANTSSVTAADSLYDNDSDSDNDSEEELVSYLMSLPPPAIDLEFRALCSFASSEPCDDRDGQLLVLRLLYFLAKQLQSALHFEIFQAYLHRALVIYSELLITSSLFLNAVKALRDLQAVGCQRFRDLVQSNLCLLKILARLPPLS